MVQRRIVFCIVAIVAGFAGALAAPPALAQSATQEILRSSLEQGAREGTLLVGKEPIHAALILNLYAPAEYQLLWSNDAQLDSLDAVAARMAREGLNPADLPLDALRAARAKTRQQDTDSNHVDVDLLATETLLRATYQLYFGKVNPALLDNNWNFSRELPAAGSLRKAIASPDLSAYLDSAIPRGSIYRATMDGLAHYRELATAGGWPTVAEGATLRAGDTDPRVRELRSRLRASGHLATGATDSLPDSDSAASTPLPDYFDAELTEAVKRFQSQHGLVIDGVVGKGTIAALNVPVAMRIDQLRMSLERIRWVQQDLQDEMLLVNIAGFQQYLIRKGAVVFQSRIMVGQPYRKTPIFRDNIEYLVLNPTWTVPPTILTKDILPAVRKNPGYLRERNLSVLTPDGQVVNPASINWQAMTAKRFPYILRQQPGPQNAMGQIKFMFPNEHLIYLHDTPSRALFDQPERTFSSGCIRIERPLELAEILLAGQSGWDRAAIDKVLLSKATKTVQLAKPVPILIMYLTAVAEPDGQVHFYRDVYKRDAALLQALDGTFAMDIPQRRTAAAQTSDARRLQPSRQAVGNLQHMNQPARL